MQIEIIEYQPIYKEDFKRLNIEWIEQYFKVEPYDLLQLDNPEEFLLDKGGAIFLAKADNEIAGTCAIEKMSETSYELVKMAVSPKFQGYGIGKILGQRVIEEAKKMGAKHFYLESNTILTPALTLYKSLGFVEVPIGETPFSRANFKAEMYF